jgi:hypothetical protein
VGHLRHRSKVNEPNLKCELTVESTSACVPPDLVFSAEAGSCATQKDKEAFGSSSYFLVYSRSNSSDSL